MKTYRKNKTFTDEQKQEIISYALEHGIWSVKKQFNVWPETVRYWIDPDLREVKKQQSKIKYNTLGKTPEQIQHEKEYREYRAAKGITRKKRKEWYNSLTPEQRQSRNIAIKQHRLDNIEHYTLLAAERYKKQLNAGEYRKRYNEDPLYKLRCNIREHVRVAVKYAQVSKTHSSILYLGCTIEEFKQHIEKQFVEGMTWDNHSRGEYCWHLDHIKPLAKLIDINDDNTLREICHYTNYQPLWEKDNLSKQDKYDNK